MNLTKEETKLKLTDFIESLEQFMDVDVLLLDSYKEGANLWYNDFIAFAENNLEDGIKIVDEANKILGAEEKKREVENLRKSFGVVDREYDLIRFKAQLNGIKEFLIKLTKAIDEK